MSTPTSAVPPVSRVLVVEPDEAVRRRVSAGLRRQGLEVTECGNVEEGRELYQGQRLVIAPLNSDNRAMREFVAWVRVEAGPVQPWIIAMGAGHPPVPGETPADYGVNDLLTAPPDSAELVRRLEAVGGERSAGEAEFPESMVRAEECFRDEVSAPPETSPDSGPAGSRPEGWNEALRALILENFPAAAAVLDRNMRYQAVNQPWFSLFRIPAISLTGLSHYDLFPGLHADWRALYEDCLENGERRSSDDLMLQPDGSEILTRWEILPWRESGGRVGGLVLVCAPVDTGNGSARAAVTALMETLARRPDAGAPSGFPAFPAAAGAAAASPASAAVDSAFREMAEAAPFGMVLLDDEARVLYANPQHRAVLGSSIPESGGMADWLRRVCPADEECRQPALDEWWENVWRRHNSLTCSLRTAEGLVKEIEFRPAPLPGDRLLLTIFDVTDARLDEQAIRSSEARHRGLFQQSSAASAIMNAAGHLTDVNPAFEALTGCLRQEMRRTGLADFLTPEAMLRLRPSEGPAAAPFASTVTHRSGRVTPVSIAAATVRNEQGHPVFTACTLMPLPEKEGGTAPAPEAVPAVPILITRTFSSTDWSGITPDLMFLLNDAGQVLDHSRSRDFESLIAPGTCLHGRFLESALPLLAAPLPLEIMMERLLDEPGYEIRCVFQLSLPGEEAERSLEARMVRMPAGRNPEAAGVRESGSGEFREDPPPAFGLTVRDISGVLRRTGPAFSDPGALLRHLRTPALLANERGRILALNPAAEAFFGHSAAALADQGLHRLFLPDDPAGFSAALSLHLTENREWCATAEFTRGDGGTGLCEVELTPCADAVTGFRGLILLARACGKASA